MAVSTCQLSRLWGGMEVAVCTFRLLGTVKARLFSACFRSMISAEDAQFHGQRKRKRLTKGLHAETSPLTGSGQRVQTIASGFVPFQAPPMCRIRRRIA